ncbi:unnamed protein product [Absidia cylindrospora]
MLRGYFDKLRIWPICLGQLVSLRITGTSSASSALWQQHHVNIPFTQNTCMYFLLTLTFGSWKYYNSIHDAKVQSPLPSTHKQHAGSALLSQQHQRRSYDAQHNTRTLNQSQSPYYLLLVGLFSVVDVQANVLAVTAFRNTSVLSALIISSWTLPCIMLLSVVLLKTRYQPVHFIGVALGLVGLGFLIWGDMIVTESNHDGDSSPSNHSWLGDIICLVSATLYAISNVTEEYLVHYSTSQDFLYRIGLTGMIQSGVLACLFEYDTLTSINWSRHNVYVLCLFFMYSLIPTIYRLAGAIFVGMSLVTSNFYSLLIGLVFLDAKMPPFYPLAYFLVIIGAALYNIVPPPVYRPQQNEQDRTNQNQEGCGVLSYTGPWHCNSGQHFEQLNP